MFVAYDSENIQAFGPFDSIRAAADYFLQTIEGRELLGISQQDADAWGTQPFNLNLPDFSEAYGLFIVEMQGPGEVVDPS